MARSNIIIVGGGLLGLCSAHYLNEAGYAITVLERHNRVAAGASHANGGLLTPSMSEPWNAPGIHWDLLRWLGRSDAPMLLRPAKIGTYLGWGVRFLANSTPSRYARATAANLALSRFSLEQLAAMRQDLGFDYSGRGRGTLKFFRDAYSFEVAQRAAQALESVGLACEKLDNAEVVKREPALADIEQEIVGGLYFADDETGDAREFCEVLQSALQARGVAFQFDTDVRAISVREGRVRGVTTPAGEVEADLVVVANGCWSSPLLARLGIRLPIRPVKGYSVSTRLRRPELMLRTAFIDDHLHAAAVPLGDTLRLAGTAEFSGWDSTLDPRRIETLWQFLEAASPRLAAVADRGNAEAWCGFRPMSADGRPFIGPTRVYGLYVNAGQGHLGWTQAAGSAALLARLIAGATPQIDATPYDSLRA